MDVQQIKRDWGSLIRKRGLVIGIPLFWVTVPAQLFVADDVIIWWMMTSLFMTVGMLGCLLLLKKYPNGIVLKRTLWRLRDDSPVHDATHKRIGVLFVATLPAFLISFSLIGNGVVTLPDGSVWQRAFFVYSFFIFMMICFGTLYLHVKNILRVMVKQHKGGLTEGQKRLVYMMYMRRLDESFVMMSVNVVWMASAFIVICKLIGGLFPTLSLGVLLLLWMLLTVSVLWVTVSSLRYEWKISSKKVMRII